MLISCSRVWVLHMNSSLTFPSNGNSRINNLTIYSNTKQMCTAIKVKSWYIFITSEWESLTLLRWKLLLFKWKWKSVHQQQHAMNQIALAEWTTFYGRAQSPQQWHSADRIEKTAVYHLSINSADCQYDAYNSDFSCSSFTLTNEQPAK